MSLDEIETFVAIARLGGFVRAAQVLHRSQPAISRRIEMLEEELRTKLIERMPSGIVLTEAGREFLPHAERILAAVRDGSDAVRALQHEEHGTVSLVMVGTLASTQLTRTLRQFGKNYPKARLLLRTANSQEVSEIVRRGEATLGLRYFGDPDPGIVCELAMEENLVVACSSDHPLAGRSVRNPRKLDGERWVSFAPQRGRRESFANAVQERLVAAGFGAAEMVYIDSLTAQKRFVEAGFGLSLLVESAIEEERRARTIDVIDVNALRAKLPVMLVRRKDGYLTRAGRELCRTLTA